MKKHKIIFACGRESTYVRNRLIWRSVSRHFESQLIADERGQSLSFRLARVARAYPGGVAPAP